MDASILQNWSVYNNDTQLIKTLEKINERSILKYQKDYFDTAMLYVKNFRTAVDAGAHYGIMSYHLNNKFNSVHSFEIFPPVRICLKENVKNFNLDKVVIHECGLGSVEQYVNLNLERGTFGTHIDPIGSNGEFLILPLDKLNLIDVDFIKIDCEGYEPFILHGAENTIKKYNPVILMERKGHTERWGLDKYEPVRILKSWGYVEKVSYKKDCIMVKE